MYHILLVDDDALFANVFSSCYNWNELGFSDPYWVEDGQKAISILQTGSFDLAFIDMCMPNMNGPELISYISQYHPELECIALSNYDDFDFVRESFRAGTKNYILKHCLNQIEMRTILEKFISDRGVSEDSTEQPQITKSYIHTGEDPIEEYLEAILTGRYIQAEDDTTVTDSLGLPLLKKNILVFRFRIKQFSMMRKRLENQGRFKFTLRTIRSVVQNIIDRFGIGFTGFMPNSDCFWVLISDDRMTSMMYQQHTVSLLAQQVRSGMQLYYNEDVEVLVAPLCIHISDLYFAYADIMKQAGEEVEMLPPGIDDKESEKLISSAGWSLDRYLTYPDFKETRRYISSLFEQGCKKKFTLSRFVQLAAALMQLYEERRKAFTDSEFSDKKAESSQLFTCSSFEELEQQVIKAYENLYEQLHSDINEGYSDYVKNAIEIIERRYSDPDLSLQTIADTLHVSGSYISRLFKQETGTGINEHINTTRIERAKDCIDLQHMTIKQTAECCGFDNYTYFFRIFKKITGYTPKEYEQRNE